MQSRARGGAVACGFYAIQRGQKPACIAPHSEPQHLSTSHWSLFIPVLALRARKNLALAAYSAPQPSPASALASITAPRRNHVPSRGARSAPPLRREYLYRRSLEGREKEVYEKKRKVAEALAAGKPIPTELRDEGGGVTTTG